MPEELGAVLEAPEVTSAEEVVEQVSEVQPELVDGDVVVQPEAVPEVKGDERVLPQWIRDLKGTNPAAFKEAKGQFFGKRTLDEKLKDFDLDGTKSFLEEHGGRESLSTVLGELKGKAEQYDGLLEKIEAGSREVLADIPPESLAKLAPAVAEEWSKIDPEGWGAAMSGIMAATIQSNGIPLFLERLAMNLEFGKTDEVAKMVDQLKGWAGSFSQKAEPRTTQPTSRQPDKLSEREQSIAQKESQIFLEDMWRDSEKFREPAIAKELESYFKRRPNDTDTHQLALAEVRRRIEERMSADQPFQKSLNALIARKDKAGALKLMESRERIAISEIVPKVGRTIFGNPGNAATTKQDIKADGQNAAKPEAGWLSVDKPPAPHTIDKFRTTDAMIMRGKFILKDGKKLQLEG